MPLHFKTGDGDLLIITEPALLARCAWQSHAIYCAALAWSIRIVIGIGRSHDKKSVLGIGCKNPDRSIPTTRYFIFNFSIIFFIFIENKYLSDVIWDLKRERKRLAKGRIKLRSIASKKAHALPSTPLELTDDERRLYCWLAQWFSNLQQRTRWGI